jgi:hypothetical protein
LHFTQAKSQALFCPRHAHASDIEDHGSNTPGAVGPSGHNVGTIHTHSAKTGISIENLPAKSAVSVSIDANDAGEHLPLVYVLICQKVA